MSATDDVYKTSSLDHQDEFVLRLFAQLEQGYKGTFLDIGCAHGWHGNNTFILENSGWTGRLICEKQEYETENKKFRKSPVLLADLSKCHWKQILDLPFTEPVVVDYISFAAATKSSFQASVQNFPWDKVHFRFCTLRHYSDLHGPENRDFARRVLEENGYYLMAGNVCHDTDYKAYEDWFIDPNEIPFGLFKKYICDSVRAIEVFCKPLIQSSQKFITTSSDHQDEFVARVLTHRDATYKGTFLDIGCGNGFQGNNTYTLEERGWTGFLIDINEEAYEWNKENRPGSLAFCSDVTTCDWNAILGKEPEEIRVFDYISFDVDNATIEAVKHFPWDTVRFRVMTIEHDVYSGGHEKRELIRQTMKTLGYRLICADVCADFNCAPFEDWFVDPKEVPEEEYTPYLSIGARAIDILYAKK